MTTLYDIPTTPATPALSETPRHTGWRKCDSGVAGITQWVRGAGRCTLSVHDNAGWDYTIVVHDRDGFSYPIWRDDPGLCSGGPYPNAGIAAEAGFGHAERVLADPEQLALGRAAAEAAGAAEGAQGKAWKLAKAVRWAREAGRPDLVTALERGEISIPSAFAKTSGRRASPTT